MHQNAFATGARPRTLLEELIALPNRDVFEGEGQLVQTLPQSADNLLPRDVF